MDLKKLPLNEHFEFGVAARKQEISNGLHHYKTGIVEGREKASIKFDVPGEVGEVDCTLRNCTRVGVLVKQSLNKAKNQPLKQVLFFFDIPNSIHCTNSLFPLYILDHREEEGH